MYKINSNDKNFIEIFNSVNSEFQNLGKISFKDVSHFDTNLNQLIKGNIGNDFMEFMESLIFYYTEDLENHFDLNIKINYSKKESLFDILTKTQVLQMKIEGLKKDDLIDYDIDESFISSLESGEDWDDKKEKLLNELDDGILPMGPFEYGGNNVCYTFEFENIENEKIIFHRIYGFDSNGFLPKIYHKNYQDLDKDLDEFFFINKWEKEFINHY